MSRFPKWSIVASLMATISLSPQAQQVDAWVITSHASTSTKAGEINRNSSLVTRTIAFGGRIRTEIKHEGDIKPPSAMGIILTIPGDSSLRMVAIDTLNKIYINLSDALNGKSSLPYMPVPKFDSVSVIVDSIGIGPVIQEHQTVHYRTVTKAVMTSNLGPESFSIPMTTTSDSYIATDIRDPELLAAFDRQANNNTDKMLPFASAEPLIKATVEARAKMAKGLALRTVMTQAMNVPSLGPMAGGSFSSQITTEIDKWERQKVDESLLRVPPGYTEKTLMEAIQAGRQ